MIFALDRDFRIVYCNEAWDRFAEHNGGGELVRPALCGRSVLDVTPDLLKPLYRSAYLAVLATGRPWQFHYECSSSAVYRLFRMTVRRLPAEDSLVVANSLLEERPHGPEPSPMPADPALYGGPGGPVAMCSLCRRTRRLDSQGWDWVPAFIDRPPAALAYSMCDDCLHKLRPHHQHV